MFKRTIALPAEVNGEKAKTDFKNGVLRVTFPQTLRRQDSRKEDKRGLIASTDGGAALMAAAQRLEKARVAVSRG